ncbi:MAG: Methyltransferase type 11 [Frankiales bacterium]|nr:Methyltransferase type 11 [Frankiales bacterium]
MTVDYAAVTARQQVVWGLGDYGRVGSLLTWIGESLVRSLDVHSGERVLDVAAGNGNASLCAARRFAQVLSTDYVPELLQETQRRADADGLALRTEVADAQHLPYDDGAFDVVMSTIGAMFAPDQEAVGRELVRVCRPGGRIGMANWAPDSMIGDMFRAVGRHVPGPVGLVPAVSWGDEARVRALLGDGCTVQSLTRQTCAFRFPSTDACLAYFRTWYGPTMAAFTAAGDEGSVALAAELLAVFAAHDVATDGSLAMDVAYLEVVATKR